MIQIDAATRELMLNNSVHREIILRFPDDNITLGSDNIVSESFELKQAICDEKNFRFGGGNVGKMEIQIIGVNAEFLGKSVQASVRVTYAKSRLLPSSGLTPSTSLIIGEQQQTEEYQLFSGTVYSAKRQKNRSIKKLTAYDVMYAFSKSEFGADAITGLLDNRFHSDNVDLYNFVMALLQTQFYDIETITCDPTAVFSNMRVLFFDRASINSVAKKNINVLKFMQAFAETNAGFLVVDRLGKLRVKSLSQYAQNEYGTEKKTVSEVITSYRTLDFDEYITKQISWVTALYQNERTYTYGSTKSFSWYNMDNVLLRMCSNISYIIRGYWNVDNNAPNYLFGNLTTFRPYKADVFARWWLEPGDRVQITTGNGAGDVQTVDSFVLSRTIKGINGMSVTIEAKGKEYLDNKEVDVNGNN